MSTITNVVLTVRPDHANSEVIASWDMQSHEKGCIVWDTTLEADMMWIGTDWVTVLTNPPTGAAPFLITATPTGASTYSVHNADIYITWSGGSGTYDLTLPDATEHPYRAIRVINDGTVSANDKVHVLAPSPQTIDGTAFYALNKPYGGVTVWSDGSNWIVIQAKS